MSDVLPPKGGVAPDRAATLTGGGRLDPWLVGVRVRELMSWLGSGPAPEELSAPPVAPAQKPAPQLAALSLQRDAAAAAVPMAPPEAPPRPEPVAERTRRPPLPRPTGPLRMNSAWTLPTRHTSLRRPDFAVTDVPPELAQIPRPRPVPLFREAPPPAAVPDVVAEPARTAVELPPAPAPLPPLPPAIPPQPAPIVLPTQTERPQTERPQTERPSAAAPTPPPLPVDAPVVTRVESLAAQYDPHWIDTPEPPAFDPAPPRRARRPRRAAAEADDIWEDELPPPPPEPMHRRRLQIWPLGLILVCVAGWFGYEALTPAPPSTLEAVVVGASVPVYAARDSRLARVLVQPGQLVMRGADLFELQPPPADDRARADAASRLDLARSRQMRLGLRAQELTALLAHQPPAKDPASLRNAESLRQRLRDVEDEQQSARDEVAQFERAAAGEAASADVLPNLRADRAAVVSRITGVEGMALVPGMMVAELLDCGGLSLSLDGDAAAKAGLVSGRSVRLRPGQGASLDLRIPDTATRGAGAAQARLMVPLDVTQWQRAGGKACPIGQRVTLTVLPG